MKLYLIERTENLGFDEWLGFVIAANSEDEVREEAAHQSADEGSEVWRDKKTPITLIAKQTDQRGIVLSSFNAG